MNSPNDEWADFQIFPLRIATRIKSDVPGSYVREALLHGLELEEKSGFNPFRFGFIGASDTHVAGGPFEESNYWSKAGAMDGTPQQRGSVPLDKPLENGEKYADVYYHLWGSAGLAGVWAEENTREAIFDAFRRKETFATSGPRIRVRFFGGFALPDGTRRRRRRGGEGLRGRSVDGRRSASRQAGAAARAGAPGSWCGRCATRRARRSSACRW